MRYKAQPATVLGRNIAGERCAGALYCVAT